MYKIEIVYHLFYFITYVQYRGLASGDYDCMDQLYT